MRSFPLAIAPAAAILAAALLAPPARAQECGMPLRYYEHAPRVADIDAPPVREALEAGNYDEVARLARARLDAGALERQASAYELRAGRKFNEEEVRVALAAAVIRTRGAQGLAAPVSAKLSPKRAEAARTRNMERARQVLQQELQRASGDPVVATLLGEAHAALGNHELAAAVLEDLAAADLIVSPEGWAALARARASAGDNAGAALAHQRCAAAARDLGVCSDDPVVARS
ncbi:MAG: hypothetical protein IT383_25710 [Deltaproteobacteria bacterium]|nr:hypothetical protein [Deltaproteobacteria bacterium]